MASSISRPRSDFSDFWGEIAPSEHIAHFYEEDAILIDTLTGFVSGGLNAGESTIIIATPQHLQALERRLVDTNVDFVGAILEDRYIALDAEAALASFMVKGWPDDERFASLVSQLLGRATVKNRRVRAFGEMVALLWARGDTAATVRLEHLWQKVCQSRSFSLFCAYPKAGCTRHPQASLDDICAAHTRVI
jgi:hypothetical protein